VFVGVKVGVLVGVNVCVLVGVIEGVLVGVSDNMAGNRPVPVALGVTRMIINLDAVAVAVNVGDEV
jgi:hypothetical protein